MVMRIFRLKSVSPGFQPLRNCPCAQRHYFRSRSRRSLIFYHSTSSRGRSFCHATVDTGESRWQVELDELAAGICTQGEPDGGDGDKERVFLVGVGPATSSKSSRAQYSLVESLEELANLSEAAGLEVVGFMQQHMDKTDPQTCLGSGKLAELMQRVNDTCADTVIFDGELTPRQLRNITRLAPDSTRICDRTALILDIFKQRALTKEGQLQVEYAAAEYQLPRLTRMWTHLERQSAGKVRGMGEKQIEVDRRLLQTRLATLREKLTEVQQSRERLRKHRSEAALPLVALVGYTNAGKSCLMNTLTAASVLSEDVLFATLDTTVRKLTLPSGLQILLSDTVGFIQKLPPQLVAAFRATLEDIQRASIILHVVDCSHPLAAAQTDAVSKVLSDIEASHIPIITVWNKMDLVRDPGMVRSVAVNRESVVCISAKCGDGVDELMNTIERSLRLSMEFVRALIPYSKGHLLAEVRANGIINTEQHTSEGTLITAHVAKHSSLLQEVARHAVSTYKLRSSVGVPVSNGATLSERQTE